MVETDELKLQAEPKYLAANALHEAGVPKQKLEDWAVFEEKMIRGFVSEFGVSLNCSVTLDWLRIRGRSTFSFSDICPKIVHSLRCRGS